MRKESISIANRPVTYYFSTGQTPTNFLVHLKAGEQLRLTLEGDELNDALLDWLRPALQGDRLVRTGNKLLNLLGGMGVVRNQVGHFIFTHRHPDPTVGTFTYVALIDRDLTLPPTIQSVRGERGWVTTRMAVTSGGIRLMTIARGWGGEST